MFFPKEMTAKLKQSIRSKQKLELVYSPLTVYTVGKVQYPVLEYIAEIKP
jgi:hypothetical protein